MINKSTDGTLYEKSDAHSNLKLSFESATAFEAHISTRYTIEVYNQACNSYDSFMAGLTSVVVENLRVYQMIKSSKQPPQVDHLPSTYSDSIRSLKLGSLMLGPLNDVIPSKLKF